MIDLAAVFTASIVCLAGVMSPGPNLVAVTHRAVTSTRSDAIALVLGIVCVNSLWASAALFGIGTIFSLFPWLFWSVKLLSNEPVACFLFFSAYDKRFSRSRTSRTTGSPQWLPRN